MSSLKFRKPLHIQGMKGMRKTIDDSGIIIPDALVTYLCKPIVFTTVVLSKEEAKIKGYTTENKALQYKKLFRLDLWIVVITLTWKTKLLSE